MPLVIMCGGCQRKLRIPDTLLGKIAKCPHCAHKSRIPAQLKSKPAEKIQNVTKTALKTVSSAPTKKPASAAAKTLPAKTAAPEANGVVAKKKTAPAAKPTPVTSIKKPSPAPAPSKNVPIHDPAEDPDAFEPDPPAIKPKPSSKPPPTTSSPPPRRSASSRKRDDDDEGGGASRVVILGGAFIGVFLVGLVIWYFVFTEAPTGSVSGMVTLDGQPVEGANVVFVGETDPKLGPYPGKTDKTGRYALAAGVRLGKYVVVVEKLVRLDGKPLGQEMTEEEARERGLVKHALPPDHAERATTRLRAVVKAGSNPVNLDLTAGK